MQTGARGDLAVLKRDPAAGLLVPRQDLRHQIALLEPCPERGMAERLELEELRQAEQDQRKLDGGEGHVVLPKALARFYDLDAGRARLARARSVVHGALDRPRARDRQR